MSASTIFAQSQATKRADKHFSRLEFVKAASDYEKLVENGESRRLCFYALGRLLLQYF